MNEWSVLLDLGLLVLSISLCGALLTILRLLPWKDDWDPLA